MKIVKCPLFLRRYCVNLFGVVFAKDPSWIDDEVINHERIHLAQMRELLFVGFYILYFFEWVFRLMQKRDWYRAYRAISFEREAYDNSSDFGYLKNRRCFGQWRKSGGV